MKRLKINQASWYVSTLYPGDGIYLVEDEMGMRTIIVVAEGAVYGTYIWMAGAALPDWVNDTFPVEKVKEPSTFEISEDVFLKALAVARGQKVSGL